MTYANTLTLTVAGASGSPFTLNRVNQDNYGSVYSYTDALQTIVMNVRHSKDVVKGNPILGVIASWFNRHNVTITHTIFATVTVPEKVCSATITLRDGKGYGPASLLAFWQGFNTLFLTLDDTLVNGDN